LSPAIKYEQLHNPNPASVTAFSAVQQNLYRKEKTARQQFLCDAQNCHTPVIPAIHAKGGEMA